MTESKKERYFLKLLFWFVFLSTLGVGGGIFFLLFAVVPIEQQFIDRGWSQFKVDSVMKYFVGGWVVFGFIMSFLYYFFILKKNHWKMAISGVIFSILLTVGGMYYFLNTNSAIVQSSQGEVVEGDRFTFGPYPSEDDLKRLKEEGYDGVISLLSSTLPIEKPLLDKEKKIAEEIGIELHSLPMLPWVGDNSKSIEKARELATQDEKRYYVHCYLGRHRVDVIKTIVNEELGEVADVQFLQPTTLERGNLFYFPEEDILIGPFPTDEEWFTRIKRGKTQQILSLLPGTADDPWVTKEQEITADIQLALTSHPLTTPATVQNIRDIAETARASEEKIYVHNFIDPVPILMLQSILTWDKTLVGAHELQLACGSPEWIGRKMMTGCNPTESDKQTLVEAGIEQFIPVNETTIATRYDMIQKAIQDKKMTYWITDDAAEQQQTARIAEGLLYGSLTRGEEFIDLELEHGTLSKHERNLLVGPILIEEEYESFAQANGVAHLIYLRSASLEASDTTSNIQQMAEQAKMPLTIIDLEENYDETLLPLLEQEQGLTYLMTDTTLISVINSYLKKY